MKEISLRKKRWPDPLPYILWAGLLLGIVISWIMYGVSAAQVQPVPTKRPAYLPTTGITPTVEAPKIVEITSTAEVPQIVEITPNLNISSVARVGKPAPDFSLNTIEGEVIKLSDLRGRPVFINLWASWCPPCRYEMPGIQAAYEKYKEKGLVVLGIDFTVQDNLPDVKSFIQEFKLTFPILLDETGDISAGLYGMRGLPTSYFIDTEGILQRIQFGAMTPEKVDAYLAEIVPE